MSRINQIAIVAAIVVAGCGSAPSVTESPAPRETTQPSGAPSAGASPSVAVLALNRAPADLGCDSIGWPDDVEPFTSLTFRIDPAAADPVTATSDTGVQIETSWVPGFEPGPATDRVVLGPDGELVARDGEVMSLVPPGARLHGYPICLTPTELSVMLNGGTG